MRITVLTSILFVFGIFITGCRGNDPKSKAIEFMESCQKGNTKNVLDILSDNDKKVFSEVNDEIKKIASDYPFLMKKTGILNLLDLAEKDLKGKKFKVLNITFYSNNKADVEIAVFSIESSSNPKVIPVRMIMSKDGQWKVYLGLGNGDASKIRESIPLAVTKIFFDNLTQGTADNVLDLICSYRKEKIRSEIEENAEKFRYITFKYEPVEIIADSAFVPVTVKGEKNAEKQMKIKLVKENSIWYIDLEKLPAII